MKFFMGTVRERLRSGRQGSGAGKSRLGVALGVSRSRADGVARRIADPWRRVNQ